MYRVLAIFIFILLLGGFVKLFLVYRPDFHKNLQLLHPTEIVDEKVGNISLYKKSVGDKELYLTLDTGESGEFKEKAGLKKLHANSFWDPKKCSQMQVVLGKENIVFVDSFMETEGDPGFSAFVFVYNIGENKLMQYESPVSIDKVYVDKSGDTEKFFVVEKDKKSGIYNLYKLNLSEAKFEKVKIYSDKKGYSLITATTTLAWCKNFASSCLYDNDYVFDRSESESRTEKAPDNAYGVTEFYKNTQIFRLSEGEKVLSFILGII